MGNNCCSNEEDYDPPGSKRPSRVDTDGFSDIRVGSAIREDEQIVDVLKWEFKETPQIFLLNNLLMCPQFFENHRKDRDQAPLTTNKIEKDLNTTLLKNENMECICPDLPMEIVNNNLRYRPLHGRKKHLSEPLIPKRMFVINNSIEVVNSMDVVQYTSIDKPAYQVRLEESSRKGFVRLKQIDTNKVQNIPFNPDEPGPSGLQVPDSDYYEYTSITDLRTPKLLQTIEKVERRDTLPVTCFTSRKVKKPDHEIYDIENNSDSEFEFNEDNLFDNVIYIDAKGFMNYFKNALFPSSLGRSLGFTQHEIDLTKSIPGKMFCNLTDDDDNPIPCEVIPSVAIQWPAELTYEFIMREDRPTITDKNTGIRYKWPTDPMIKEMRTFNCMLIPKGYWMKRGQYSDATIEWEIAFPKAERYLEARMSHVQIRCYLFLLTLHKTFIDPVTQQHGLLIEHIRCHMYWECEANYRDWPEHRLGTKILKVIENLCQCLSKSELPDYFIKQKNHFRNIPKKYLHFAQKVLNEILQNPVVHFIKALRCLRYTSGKFYHPFEFKEFYRILVQTQGYKLVNPNIIPNLRRRHYGDPEMQWRYLQEQAKRKKILDDRNKEFGNFKDEEDTESVDSIDLDWNCEKQFEVFKAKLILCHFIKTFIAIAKDVFRFGGTENQCLLYLKQASYLTKLLEATSSSLLPEAREFQQQIYVEQEAFQRSAVLRRSNKPPETPIRNSIQFDFSMTQQLKNNAVNLSNLHNAYNGSGVKLVHTTSVKPKASPILRLKSEVNKRKSLTVGGGKSVTFINP